MVQSALQHLTKVGIVRPTRMVGNAQVYRFNVENGLHSRVDLTDQLQQGKGRQR
jgi:hypothetical protein